MLIGINFSQVDGDGFSGYNKIGLNSGAWVLVKLGKRFGSSLELDYSQKGSKVRRVTESYYTGTSVEGYDLKLNYAEIPLLFHYLPEGKFIYSAGASYGRLIQSKEEAFTIAPVNLNPEINYFRKQDFNSIVGASYVFYKNWLINLRYAYSLTTIRDPQRVPQGYGGGNQKNNLFTLKLVILF